MQTALKPEAIEVKIDTATSILQVVPGIMNIGRDTDNDIQLDETDISPHHARIITYFHESFVIDLGSETGILLNGEPVRKHSIRFGDVLTLGQHNFIMHAPAEWFY